LRAAKTVAIRSRNGLHARPAALFVKTASKFKCDVTVSAGKLQTNGKSIVGLMTLGIGGGARLTIAADGDDAEQAVEELERLLVGDIWGPEAAEG
jgi:phosphotransferase system HPr (HPr) family protein